MKKITLPFAYIPAHVFSILPPLRIFAAAALAITLLIACCPVVSFAQLAKGEGKFLGNIFAGFKNNGMTADPLFTTYWNQATPENAGKHGLYETSRDVYQWNALDEIYAYCQNNNIPFKQHAFLFWCCGADADWLLDLSDAAIRAEIEEWIIHFFNRYPNTAYAEVVNEPFQSPPPFKIRNALGGDTNYAWVRWMYTKARQHAPAACELWINENNVLKGGSRVNSYKDLISFLIADGNLDGIGMQGHWLEGVAASTIQNTLNQMDDLGLPLYITEYEVHISNDTNQRNIWAAQFPVMWEHPAVQGVTLWGYKQGQMWRSNGYLVRSDGSERPAMAWLKDYFSSSSGGGLKLQAEDHNASQGINTYSTIIGSCDNNDWIRFENVDLGSGFQKLAMRYARGTSGDRWVEVRMGSFTGTKIAEIHTENTGSWDSYTTKSVNLSGGTGIKTLYFVFKGGGAVGNFDWFEFSGQAGATIKVFAAGKANTETMTLLINGNTVQTWNNIGGNADNRVFSTYTYNHSTSVSPSEVKVRFSNDASGRDLRVNKIEINGTSYQSEASTTYSTGTWTSDNACAGGYKQSEWLNCNGYFAYACTNCRDVNGAALKSTDAGPTTNLESRPTELHAYPNPTGKYLNISLNALANEQYDIEIVSASGQRMKTFSQQATGQNIQLSTEGLSAGVYFVKIRSSKTETVERIIVRR